MICIIGRHWPDKLGGPKGMPLICGAAAATTNHRAIAWTLIGLAWAGNAIVVDRTVPATIGDRSMACRVEIRRLNCIWIPYLMHSPQFSTDFTQSFPWLQIDCFYIKCLLQIRAQYINGASCYDRHHRLKTETYIENNRNLRCQQKRKRKQFQ